MEGDQKQNGRCKCFGDRSFGVDCVSCVSKQLVSAGRLDGEDSIACLVQKVCSSLGFAFELIQPHPKQPHFRLEELLRSRRIRDAFQRIRHSAASEKSNFRQEQLCHSGCIRHAIHCIRLHSGPPGFIQLFCVQNRMPAA
jgi:hypothetical protein